MRLKLPDTLLIREESEERYKWLFTAKNGRLMKKLNSSVAPNPCAKACAQFSQEAAFGRKSHSSADPAGVLYYEGEKSKLCSIADLELLPLSKVEPHAVALQKVRKGKRLMLVQAWYSTWNVVVCSTQGWGREVSPCLQV